MRKFIMIVLVAAMAGGLIWANGTDEASTEGGMKEYSVFLGYPKEDYPQEGTILGDWIEEQTNVKINWEFIVGDLDQKVGIIAASGDYPDAIHPRNLSSVVYDAGAYIELDGLIESHGPNIQKLYGERLDLIRYGEEKKIYWFPQVMPYGNKIRKTGATHGIWFQKAVLEEYGWPEPKTLDEAFDLLLDYREKYPEINGNETIAFTGLYDGWRWFPVASSPSQYAGNPNDGGWMVTWNGDKFIVSHPAYGPIAKETYRKYNRVYLAGGYDAESFVMDYDQYLAKMSTGAVLAHFDQGWQFGKIQNLLKDQDQDRWYVCLPVMLDETYVDEHEGPLQPQVSEGIGITVDCKDPEGLMTYFNFLAGMDTLVMKNWGRKGVDYMVGADGVFYRTDEQIAQWQNQSWVDYTFGKAYWSNFLSADGASLMDDGLNNFAPANNPDVFQAQLRDAEIEVLEAYGKDSWFDFFNAPDVRRESYFPAWTIRKETGSLEQITEQKLDDIRRKYIPLLIMADQGDYDNVWEEFINEVNRQVSPEDYQALIDYMQLKVDERVDIYGGYDKVKAMK